MSATLLDRCVEVAASLELERVPEPVVCHAGHTIADTVGVIRGGMRQPEMRRLLDLLADEHLLSESSAAPFATSTVLDGRGLRTAPAQAAFLNATAGTFLELDEGVRPTGHPGMHVVPAALAVAESTHASGRELLRAVLAGYEVTARLFQAIRLTYPVHPHGHFGAVGAAVAVALLAGPEPVAAARIASTTPLLPVWDACYEGATARNTYMGYAAQMGVVATTLARSGFRGSQHALTVAYGQVAGELVDAEALERELAYDDLGITHNYFKRHSACALSHAAIDAVRGLDLPAPELIERIRVETVSNNLKLDRQPLPNDLSARFSLPYAVATAVWFGRTGPEEFQFRPEVARLAERVEIAVTPDLEAEWPEAAPARVRVISRDGERSATVKNPHGHWTDPLTPEELQGKFRQLIDDQEDAATWWARLTDLPRVGDCADLWQAR